MADVTDLYRTRLSTGNALLLARVRALWTTVFNPLDPAGSLSLIGATVGRWVTGAQAGAAAEATAYLRALIAEQASMPLPAVEPFPLPSGLVGKTASGSTVMRYLSQAPGVFYNRKGQGYSDELAANSTLAWLNRTAGSEPYRVANNAVNANATHDKRFAGRVRRITRSDCCDFCSMIADRGYIPSHADFAAHAHCRCTAEPEVSSYVYSKSSIARGRAAYMAGQAPAPAPAPVARDSSGKRAEDILIDGIGLRGMGGDNNPLYYLDAEARTRQYLHDNLDNISPANIAKLTSIEAIGTNDPLFAQNSWLAYYQDQGRFIRILPSQYSKIADKADKDTVNNGWWTPDGKTDGAGHTLSHELGHFLDYRLSEPQRYEVITQLGERFGINTLDEVKGKVSEYGGKNDKEMMAELWAEYKTSPNPRPPAQYAGSYIEDKLGRNPSPTPSLDELRKAHLDYIDAQWRAANRAAAA